MNTFLFPKPVIQLCWVLIKREKLQKICLLMCCAAKAISQKLNFTGIRSYDKRDYPDQ